MKIFPIIRENEKKRLRFLEKSVVEEPAHFSDAWLMAKQWIAVPVESAGHFDREDASRLSRAFKYLGWKEVFAVATEPLSNFPNYFLVNVSEEGLLEFSQICAHFNFVLLPDDRSGAILCTVYDYYLIGGSPQFVSIAVGGDIEAARARFDEFADDPHWEGRLMKVAKRYAAVSSATKDN